MLDTKLKMTTILDMYQGLETLKDREPTITLGYKIAKNLYKTKEAIDIYRTVEKTIINQYIDREETEKLDDKQREQGSIIVKDPISYETKINELNNTEHEISLESITLEELENNFGNITPDILCKLMPIIEN